MTRVDIETIIADFHAGRADRDPFDEIQALITELRRCEGDLAVAVAEAQRVRAQRQAALDLCDAFDPVLGRVDVVSTRAVRAALGAADER